MTDDMFMIWSVLALVVIMFVMIMFIIPVMVF